MIINEQEFLNEFNSKFNSFIVNFRDKIDFVTVIKTNEFQVTMLYLTLKHKDILASAENLFKNLEAVIQTGEDKNFIIQSFCFVIKKEGVTTVDELIEQFNNLIVNTYLQNLCNNMV